MFLSVTGLAVPLGLLSKFNGRTYKTNDWSVFKIFVDQSVIFWDIRIKRITRYDIAFIFC